MLEVKPTDLHGSTQPLELAEMSTKLLLALLQKHLLGGSTIDRARTCSPFAHTSFSACHLVVAALKI